MGARRIEHQLARDGTDPVPSRSAIYRCLRRHGLIELRRRRKRRDELHRWERERPMQLWQMDVMGGVMLDDATELKVVTGVGDDSRYCVTASLVHRAATDLVSLASWSSSSPRVGSVTIGTSSERSLPPGLRSVADTQKSASPA